MLCRVKLDSLTNASRRCETAFDAVPREGIESFDKLKTIAQTRWPGRDSNSHGVLPPQVFETCMSTVPSPRHRQNLVF